MGSMEFRQRRRFPATRALPVALALDLLAVTLLAATVILLSTRDHRAAETFFSDPLPAALLVAAGLLAIVAGAVALRSLVAEPLRTAAGRWAWRLAAVNALLLPAIGLSVTIVAWLAGVGLPDAWGQPLVPAWVLIGVVAGLLGAVAREPGRRGLLVVPFMLGALVLVFWVGELVVPH